MISLREDKIDLGNKGTYLFSHNRLKFLNKENSSLDILPLLLNNIPVTIVFESNGEHFDVIYNDIFLLTILKFINNEISITNIKFSDLTRPQQRKIENYSLRTIIIDHNQNKEEVLTLIKSLNNLHYFF